MNRRNALLLVALVGTLVALLGASVYVSSTGERGQGSVSTAPEMPGAIFAGFIGDNVTAGSPNTDRSSRWTSVVAASKGWSQFNVAQQSTSYLIGSGSVAGQIASLPPRDYRFIFISFTLDSAQVADKLSRSASDAAVKDVKQRYPGAEVIAISPVAVNSRSLKAAQSAGEILESSVERLGGRYVEIGQPLLQGPTAASSEPTDQAVQTSIATTILARLGRS